MRAAIAEAQKGIGRTAPNPAVGAVITDRRGKILARGYHKRAGTDHAEVDALRKLAFKAKGRTLYCTLEPCCFRGRTGACTDAVIAAGIRRVVVGAVDPNPKVAGRGLKLLQSAGIEVVSGVLADACEALNEPYNHAIVAGRPLVILKAATSLDGRIATRTGHSQWITGEAARAYGHRLRHECDAVIVGVDTVIADDPSLTARIEGGVNPLRVVMDSRLRTPMSATLVETARDVPTLIATTKAANAKRRARLEAAGVDVVTLRKTRAGRVDPRALLAALHKRGVSGVLIEGGAQVHGTFVDAKLVDRVAIFVAPMIIGGEGAPSSIAGRGARRLQDALRLVEPRVEPVGGDFVVTARVRR